MSNQVPTNRPSGHYQPQPEKKPMNVTWKQIVLAIAVIVFLIFALTNLAKVRVNFVVAEVEAPLVVIVIISFLIGMLVSWLLQTIRKNNHK